MAASQLNARILKAREVRFSYPHPQMVTE